LLAGKQQRLFPRNRAFPYSAVFSICASIWACRILPQINAPRNPQVQTEQFRDLTASAARIFGWDTEKPGVQLNQQFVISTEQLQQIRALREQADAQERSTAANQRNGAV
jgi:hypothetical protein